MSRFCLDETTVRLRIQQFQDDFFDSVDTGDDSLKEFSDRWAEFTDTVSPSSYSPETMQLLYRVSNVIGLFCESLIHLEEAAQEIERDVFDCASRIDPSEAAIPTRRDVSSAAEWMAQNFFNPYPSTAVRDDISRTARWPRKDVDNWFTEARKRIGWNTIRKQFFANRQAEAVKAATDFFNGQSQGLEPALESALSAMADRVQELYIEPYQSSKLLTVLGRESKNGSRAETYSIESFAPLSPATHSYPISPISRPHSPVSRSVSPIRPVQKRRRSLVDSGDETDREVRSKRARHGEPAIFTFSQTQLPSPPASQSELVGESPRPVFGQSSDLAGGLGRSPSVVPLSNRKRRRSHSEAQGRPKYPSIGRRVPGLQTVSAPLPIPALSQCNSSLHPISTSSEILSPSQIEASACSNSPTPNPAAAVALSDARVDLVHDLLSQAEIPQFSFEFPDPVTCEQPATIQPIDLTFGSASTQPCVPTLNGNVDLSATLAPLGTAPQVMPTLENADITSLSGFLNESLNDQQLLELLPLSFDQVAVPPVQANALPEFTEVDVNFSQFLDFDSAGLPQLLDQRIDDDVFFADFLHNVSPVPSVAETDKAKQMAHLEILKKQQNHLQERIESLERQITGRVSA
ncbi:hypothetical protein P691DRAFT_800668 [Macrolepiota fuliginosa MF-IS2]|uniref:Uncharacterized protein n=1 Tax=Macrolepiota fuliginosa MF-IS2 TaxID=1400762 RepID=A0A9P5WXQ2_9AGAR|nr:hypothetical protein P691DRAFT_800668 [Macrolepiota fuliginosa MF-IS2]